jgi:hypothetical protein
MSSFAPWFLINDVGRTIAKGYNYPALNEACSVLPGGIHNHFAPTASNVTVNSKEVI